MKNRMATLAVTAGALAILSVASTASALIAAERTGELTAELDDARAQVGLTKMYEDGSYVLADGTSGCAPSALCDDAYRDILAAEVPSGITDWDGLRVGEVILCPPGWIASVDDAPEPAGYTWAACM